MRVVDDWVDLCGTDKVDRTCTAWLILFTVKRWWSPWEGRFQVRVGKVAKRLQSNETGGSY